MISTRTDIAIIYPSSERPTRSTLQIPDPWTWTPRLRSHSRYCQLLMIQATASRIHSHRHQNHHHERSQLPFSSTLLPFRLSGAGTIHYYGILPFLYIAHLLNAKYLRNHSTSFYIAHKFPLTNGLCIDPSALYMPSQSVSITAVPGLEHPKISG